MSQIKTAISIEKGLFEELDGIAHQIRVPRSQLFEKAVKEWLKKERQKRLADEVSRAVRANPITGEDKRYRQAMRRKYREAIKDQW